MDSLPAPTVNVEPVDNARAPALSDPQTLMFTDVALAEGLATTSCWVMPVLVPDTINDCFKAGVTQEAAETPFKSPSVAQDIIEEAAPESRQQTGVLQLGTVVDRTGRNKNIIVRSLIILGQHQRRSGLISAKKSYGGMEHRAECRVTHRRCDIAVGRLIFTVTIRIGISNRHSRRAIRFQLAGADRTRHG